MRCGTHGSGWKSGTGCSMLAGSLDTKADTTHHQGKEFNEAKRLYQGHRIGRGGRGDDCRAGDRAIDAGNQMAHDDELAEIARHAVRRRRDDGQGGRRSHRQQISDPDFCRRRNRSRPAGARCRAERHRRDGPHGVLLLFRQGSDLHLRHGRAVRAQPAHQPGLVHAGRRQGTSQRVLQEATTSLRCLPATPAARWAAGSARRSTRSTISRA